MTQTTVRFPVRAAAACLLLILFFLLAMHSAETAAVTAERLHLCLETLIPSLFGCMAAANLLTDSGAAAWLGFRMRIFARLLKIPPELLTVFLVSQIAGYPVGTLLLCRMTAANRLPKDTAGRFACVCFGGGPAFLVGFAGSRLFGSAAVGWMMLTGCVLSNLLLLMLTPKPLQSAETAVPTVRLTADALPKAVSGAMRSLAAISGMVLLFGICTLLCDLTGITGILIRIGGWIGLSPQTVRAMLAACADVTQLHRIFACGFSFRMLAALSAALLSFGGICVHLQCTALSGGIVRLRRLLLTRLAAACITFLIIYVLSDVFDLSETVAAFAHPAALSHSGSPLPAILIFCTGFPFLIKKD